MHAEFRELGERFPLVLTVLTPMGLGRVASVASLMSSGCIQSMCSAYCFSFGLAANRHRDTARRRSADVPRISWDDLGKLPAAKNAEHFYQNLRILLSRSRDATGSQRLWTVRPIDCWSWESRTVGRLVLQRSSPSRCLHLPRNIPQ